MVYKSPQVILQLYKYLVQPHMEYCSAVWRPHLQKDSKIIRKSTASYDENDTRLQAHTYGNLEGTSRKFFSIISGSKIVYQTER